MNGIWRPECQNVVEREETFCMKSSYPLDMKASQVATGVNRSSITTFYQESTGKSSVTS